MEEGNIQYSMFNTQCSSSKEHGELIKEKNKQKNIRG